MRLRSLMMDYLNSHYGEDEHFFGRFRSLIILRFHKINLRFN
jgi:hypothetical protein